MKYPHLIILYGRFGDKPHWKQQRMIDGGATCGYRHYAKRFGEIIYLTPQEHNVEWGHSKLTPSKLISYLVHRRGSIIWSVKHDPTGQKDEILRNLPNHRAYYSCCAYNTICNACDISLVDIPSRIKNNAVLWVKGKDPDYWKPKRETKPIDYIMIGSRGDKNETYFINRLTKEVKEKRSIMWVGGGKYYSKIEKSHHDIYLYPFVGMEQVRDYIDTAKVGIILSEIKAEGFPQTFLEMTMMGVPVVYMGPINDKYVGESNCIISNKIECIEDAERMLRLYPLPMIKCREEAINNYSLEESYKSILRGLNWKK